MVERLRIFPIVTEGDEVWPTKPTPVATLRHDHPPAFEMIPWGIKGNFNDSKLVLFARAETVDTKPMWRASFRYHRCLVAMDGFWEGARFERPDGGPLVMAGILGRWIESGRDREGFVPLTTSACESVAPYNERQPLILPEDAWGTWLDPITDIPILKKLLVPWQDLVETAPPPTPRKPVYEEPPAEDQLELQW